MAKTGTSKTFWAMYGTAFLIAVIGFAVAYRFVGPPPPKTFRLAGGAQGGAYHAFALRYAEFMAARGIRVEVVETAGTAENLRLLADSKSAVDVAFVQGGVADVAATRGLVSLGSVCFEPLWVFQRTDTQLLSELVGKRIAVGTEGSGTRPLALRLLAANGIEAQNSQLLPLGGTAASTALLAGQVDALFTVASVEAESVRQLLLDERVVALSFRRADAYARRYRFLSSVRLPEGCIDLARNRPATDLHLVSPAATLVARESFHPALVDLLLQGAASVHAGGDMLAEPGQFPSRLYCDFSLSRDAERYYKYGPPFLQRFLPFGLATTIERIKVMVLPLLVLLLPLLKIVPPTFRWQIRRKIIRWYRQLHAIDAGVELADAAAIAALQKQIEDVDRDVMQVSVPLGYADQLYNLRAHIALVRDRIATRRARLTESTPPATLAT